MSRRTQKMVTLTEVAAYWQFVADEIQALNETIRASRSNHKPSTTVSGERGCSKESITRQELASPTQDTTVIEELRGTFVGTAHRPTDDLPLSKK